MDSCTGQLNSSVRALSEPLPEIATPALRFLDLMLGGFGGEETLEFTLDIPHDWRDQEIQVLVFLNDRGQWVELEGRAERQGEKLKLSLPGGCLVHLAVALVPHAQPHYERTLS